MTVDAIELRAVTRTYEGKDVLKRVSVTFSRGEHTAIVGPSGGGKSTLLRIVAGLETPTAGEVLFDGEAVSVPGRTLRPPHQRGLSMVFQDLALWPNLSVLENVVLGLSGAMLPAREIEQRAARALALCSIDGLAFRKPGVLSGGEQQRVALARALAVRPSFLLLDEPFSGLDLVTKLNLVDEIRTMVTEQHVTLLVVTHDPVETRRLCRSAVLIDGGRVEEAGRLDRLLESPRSPFLRTFRELW